MKKIFIPVFLNSKSDLVFSPKKGNPGVGGTKFLSIILAFFLAERNPTWQVIIINSKKVLLDNAPSNLKQEIFLNISDFFALGYKVKSDSVVIASTSILSKVEIQVLKQISERVICWCHHPFDKETLKLADEVPLGNVVCVGTYQYHSNKTVKAKVAHIQNISLLPDYKETSDHRRKNQNETHIVHLGALIPSKGFLEVAKSWSEIKRKIPNVKLHVIGSSLTYGIDTESDLIPTSVEYASEILKWIPEEDVQDGLVVFYGNLGAEKFDIITACDLAILNPKGYTEAFPASPLECMACGTPVIASDDYGMSDCMRFFPELVVNGHQDIADKVKWLVHDPSRFREIQQRSIAVATWFVSQTDFIITRWERLISSYFEGSIDEISLQPTMPFYGNKAKLFYRLYFRGIVNWFKYFLGLQ